MYHERYSFNNVPFVLILLYCIEEIDYSSMFWINVHTCNRIYSLLKTQLVSTYPLELALEVCS